MIKPQACGEVGQRAAHALADLAPHPQATARHAAVGVVVPSGHVKPGLEGGELMDYRTQTTSKRRRKTPTASGDYKMYKQ